ncbi:MAG: glycosyltransferase family 2 protein, partial [Nitrospiraceae bacterium]
TNLRVIDKENGGKADALNAGINLSRYPLVCCVDADSILQRDSLQRVVQPFLEDPTTVACGGTVRVVNGCEVSGGFLINVALPQNWLALFQIIEYLRAFLFGRMGWSPINAVLIISGAFGLFHRDTVIAVGGYRHDTIGEDMELAVRLHRRLRDQRKEYRITFVPDPTCWTEAPENLRTLKNQRIRWQRGLLESLWAHRDLLFGRNAGTVGWLAFPFLLLFEALSPVVEIFGYVIMTLGFGVGVVSATAVAAFLMVAIGFGVLLSVSALLLEELSFHVYPRPKHLVMLFLAAIGENFGYRQLNAMWKLIGTVQWIRGTKGKWGEMTRTASWQSA